MIWDELSYDMGRAVFDYGTSCLGPISNCGDLSRCNLSLVRVSQFLHD